MTPTNLELANDFARRWLALPKERRSRLCKQISIGAMQIAALNSAIDIKDDRI